MGEVTMDASARIARRGFTLLELLTVIIVVAVLTTLAVAAYRHYELRANRIEATTTLLRIQVAQEKFFLQNNRYAATLGEITAAPPAGLGVALVAGNQTANGYYTLSLPRVTATSYVVAADATGPQGQDVMCLQFSIDQNGARTPTTAGCWR